MSRTPNVLSLQPAAPSPCRKDESGDLKSYDDVVAAYIRDHRRGARRVLRFFQCCTTLERAIEYAARCKLPSGKRHPHQYRISAAVLVEAERRLRANAVHLRKCQTFAELHELIQDQIGGVQGIGALTVYDVANHLGAYLGLEPEVIYLHAGTARGAKALGLGQLADTLSLAELPPVFQQLRPHEIEDCLCLYNDALEAIGA